MQTYKQLATADKIRLFLLDEIKLTLLPTITQMWTKKGSQEQILTDDNHGKCYGYTAIDWVQCKTHYRIAEDFNGNQFSLFIEQLTKQYPNQTVVIVMDNAPAHGFTKQHGEVKVTEQLYFYFLPPYSAVELNPVEKVFKFFRHKVTHNQYFAELRDLIEAARNFYRYLYVCRKRVASLLMGEV